MDIFEGIVCFLLALVTLAVFRKELLKVKDILISFWIPKKKQKSQKDSDVKKRTESNKENISPSHFSNLDSKSKCSSPYQTVENGIVTKEIKQSTNKETTTKVTETEEGLRIKSATLLPDVITFPPTNLNQTSFENFTSQKLAQNSENVNVENSVKDPFPSFSEIFQGSSASPIDTSSSTVTREVKNDGNTITEITTKHEVQGNTERSFIKKEEESVSKSILTSDAEPSITHDAKDLNELIKETQKKLESFKNGFRSPTPDTGLSSSTYEVKKREEIVSETKKTDIINSINEIQPHIPDLDSIFKDAPVSKEKNEEPKKVAPPVPPKPKIRPLKDPIMDSFNDCLREMERDLEALNGSLGYSGNTSESSCVTEETPFGTTIVTKKKKMFTSSSFYEEPHSIYPTVEEQVEMARKIAGSLADDTNMKSKGANMFFKRVKKSTKWIHEGPEPSDESAPGTPEIQGLEPPTPDPSQVPFKPSKGPTKLKLVMDSRHPLDLNALRSSGLAISEHNVVSPEVCHGIVKDLQSPKGKGAALFAKRKKKSEDWVVDEERVNSLLREKEKINVFHTPSPYSQYSNFTRSDVKLIKTPWEAAMESPFGLCDAAFVNVNPDKLADTVIRAADNKRSSSITRSWEPSGLESCISPPPMPPLTPAAAQYDIYHAKAPKGWMGSRYEGEYVPTFPAHSASEPSNTMADSTSSFNSYTAPRKINFQNFNTVPRLWKGASAH